MCYCRCKYEQYPDGPNEDCRCHRGKHPCPMSSDDGPADYQSAADKDDYEPEPERDWEREERERDDVN